MPFRWPALAASAPGPGGEVRTEARAGFSPVTPARVIFPATHP